MNNKGIVTLWGIILAAIVGAIMGVASYIADPLMVPTERPAIEQGEK